MHIVAIHSLGQDRETRAPALSKALGITMYEALSRLRSPGNGPFTIAVFAEEQRAIQTRDYLQFAGFSADVLSEKEISAELSPFVVRRFALGEDGLTVTADTGQVLIIPFQHIRFILKGIGIVRGTTTETIKDRSVNLGRAVLSGGLLLTKTTKTVKEVATEERSGFFNIYAEGNPAVVFREDALAYDSLGPALQPSRALNFAYVIAELRRRCLNARYDERLLTRPAQVALLGPTLNPEEHLNVATALLAKIVRLCP